MVEEVKPPYWHQFAEKCAYCDKPDLADRYRYLNLATCAECADNMRMALVSRQNQRVTYAMRLLEYQTPTLLAISLAATWIIEGLDEDDKK